jgi:DNA-binding NtrC family response regulator
VIESSGGTRSIRLKGRRATAVRVERFGVTVTEGPDSGHSVVLSSTSIRVGTDPSGDLVLTDATCSRRHALLTLTPDGVRLEDLGSRNGTFVNGVRIEAALLEPGAVILVGASVLKLTRGPGEYVVVPDEAVAFGGLYARSEPMRDVFALIRQLARTDLPVALTGETGTGKELVARALHQFGPRAARPFVVLDCGSIVPELLHSQIFGHEKGAFTGADRQTPGVFEAAAGGTVFLDEVGEIDLAVQPNLLRALEIKEVIRLGSQKPVPVDFRVLSATNRDLRTRAQEGSFRQDLYYRLSCVTIRLPSLRERTEDIPLLVDHFLAECAARHETPAPKISPGALDLLMSHSWPGNVRELRNVVESTWALAEAGMILEEQVRRALPPAPPPQANPLEAAEKTALEAVLAETAGNYREAARRLGISLSTMYEKLRRHGLKSKK